MEKEPKQPLLLFEDAQELARSHPDTFVALSPEVLKMVSPGKLVKVCAGDERFWVIVTGIDNGHITGAIDNDLHNTEKHGLVADDIIVFEYRHIHAIWLDGDEHLNGTGNSHA